MDTNQSSESFLKAQATLKETRDKLIELYKSDLSGIHVHQDWSWVPYLNDHLNFIIEQIGGLELSLRDGPPPVSEEDLKRLVENKTE
jgi:hypothetical protein